MLNHFFYFSKVSQTTVFYRLKSTWSWWFFWYSISFAYSPVPITRRMELMFDFILYPFNLQYYTDLSRDFLKIAPSTSVFYRLHLGCLTSKYNPHLLYILISAPSNFLYFKSNLKFLQKCSLLSEIFSKLF